MTKKLNKVRDRRYIAPGPVTSLTSFFSVPKGDDDIRMVYDGTKSGLNDCMWVPRFGLPTIDTHLRSVDESTYLADIDVGECFLNFPFHEDSRSTTASSLLVPGTREPSRSADQVSEQMSDHYNALFTY